MTQMQWRAVAKGVGLPEAPSHFKGDRLPVEQVSWYDAARWCNALSALERRPLAYTIGAGNAPDVKVDLNVGYRLPTEAEWEHVRRAGTGTRWSLGDDEGALSECGWFSGNSGGKTHPVGEKRPNRWGLYDVHGNVWEWTGDRWCRSYTREAVADPFLLPAPGDWRVIRGGGWSNVAEWCRSACRDGRDPGRRDRYQGFRVVLPVPRLTLDP